MRWPVAQRHLDLPRQQSVGWRMVAVLGEPRHDFHRACVSACRKAGVPGMLRHDMRRSATRNMVNAGCPSASP